MSLEETVSRLARNLAGWGGTGLNEAQTSQVIVLPLLQALGYDIWNPLEVAAQIHSGGGNAAYAPDFTIKLGDRICFITEVKALNKGFLPNDTTQAVNYVNALGRRWAVLTNGKAWHFYDNQVPKPAADKLELTVELRDARAAGYLERLLSRRVWDASDAEQALAAEVGAVKAEIQRHLDLGKIEGKLRRELQAGFTADEKGLTRAIQLTLEPNERELAEESFGELALRLGIATEPAERPDPEPNPVNPRVPEPAVIAQLDVFTALIDGMHKTAPGQRSSRSSELRAWLNDTELPAANWRDINAGIVEAMMTLDRKRFVNDRGYIFPTNQSRAKSDGKLYPTSAYRQLSDGDFLFLHDSANNHIQRSRRMLEELGVSPRAMRIVYRGDTFYLP